MPYILEKCLYNVYQRKGWDLTSGSHPAFTNKNGNSLDSDKLDAFYEIPEHIYYFPTLSDLKEEVDYYIRKELSYANEQTDNLRTAIVVRLESLCTGAKGSMFNTYGFTSMEDLLNQSAVFEMEHLADDDDKAFFVGLMLTFISEYRQLQNPAINVGIEKGLKHFLIIEEAHRLLKNINTERSSEEMGNPKGKAVETFCNIISEMRGLGQGVAVIEQIPTKISPDVIKNSNTKIIHRLVAKDDQKLVASSLCINEAEALYLGQLTTGHALVHKEGMEKPLECLVYNDIHIGCITDEKVHSLMKSYKQNDIKQHSSYSINLNREERQWVLFKFLNTLAWNNMINIDLKDIVKTVQNDILIRLPNVVSEKELNSYIAKSLIEAISYKMFWAQNYSFKSGFLETCYKLFDKKTDDSAFDFLKILSDTWGVNAEGLLQDNLINYLKIKCTNKNYDTLQNDLKHCFLACVDNDTIEFINSKIKEIL
jgi:hypothetical protein